MSSSARAAISAFEQAGHDIDGRGPHFHVSATLKKNRTESDFVYIRVGGHPHHVRIGRRFARLEGGTEFCVRSDGMGAIAMALYGALAVRKGPIVLILPVYGGTYELVRHLAEMWNVPIVFLYADDPNLLEELARMADGASAIFFEVSTNPTLRLLDIEKIVRIAKSVSIPPLVICDDTFLFGIVKPFQWGVDVIVGSGTKYPAGESAYSMGYCGISNVGGERLGEFWRAAKHWAIIHGGTLAPAESWLTTLSLRDVHERIRAHSRNALAVARALEAHPAIERVIYPGLPSYPDRELVSKYLTGMGRFRVFGGMVTFALRGANLERTKKFLRHLTRHSHIHEMASLAGPGGMIESPADLSHACYTAGDRLRSGIAENLVRLSVDRLYGPNETVAALTRSLAATM